MSYKWINADNPEEELTVPWQLYGAQDDISKAFGSGLTYSERYFILKFFQAPTDADDPDSRNTSDRGRGNKKGLSEAQVKRGYALGFKAGYDRTIVDKQILSKFNKKIQDLTKEEYEIVCNGYEKSGGK